MASTSLTGLFYVKETTFGVTPASSLKELRYTGESLKPEPSFEVSNEIRPDRQVTDHIRTMMRAGGGVNFEWSFGAHDDLIEGALMSTWGTAVNYTGSDISFASADNSINSTSTPFNTRGHVVGQWIRPSGAGVGANGKPFRIKTIAANKMVLEGNLVTTQSNGAAVTIRGTPIQNGVTPITYTLEKAFNDVSPVTYEGFSGMAVNTWTGQFAAGQVMTGTLGFTGTYKGTSLATLGTGATTAAAANDVLNGTDHCAGFFEGLSSAVKVGTFSWSWDNGVAMRERLGAAQPFGSRLGQIGATGQIEAFFEDRTLYDKLNTNTATSFAVILEQSASLGLSFDWPSIRLTNGSILAEGKNGEVYAKMDWAARRDPTIGKTVTIARW